MDGVENEPPRFQRFDKYPTELEKERERCTESSPGPSSRADDSFKEEAGDSTGIVCVPLSRIDPALLSTPSEETVGPGSEAAGETNLASVRGDGWAGDVSEALMGAVAAAGGL